MSADHVIRDLQSEVERLTKELQETRMQAISDFGQYQEAFDRADAAEARAQSVEAERDAKEAEFHAISYAIKTPRFMDPPDGGDVSLAEQVKRMRETLEAAEAKLAEMRGVLSGLALYLSAGSGDENTTADEYDKRIRWGIDYHCAAAIKMERDACVKLCAPKDGEAWTRGAIWTGDLIAARIKARDALRSLVEKGGETPAARWREEDKSDPFGDRYNCERAALTGGQMTDDELASAVYLDPNIANLTAAKDRIRWLSRKLVEKGGEDGE